GNYLSPSFSMGVKQIKNGYIDFKRRGVKIRFITEITKDNINFCKELMQYVELRHTPAVKGNMAVSETEYVATAELEGEAKPVTQTIYSNAKAIIEQHKYFFENLWSIAIPAELKIIEIEEGTKPIKTGILEDDKEISKKIIELAKNSNEMSICSTIGGMQLIYNRFFEAYKDALKRYRNKKHKGIRWVVSINNKKDIELVKVFLKEGVKIHHVNSEPLLSFALSDKILNSTIEKMEKGIRVSSLLTSNDYLYLNHYSEIFKELWKTGIDAKDRIKDIEEGRYINVKIILNPKKSIKFVSELNRSAKKEILIILSSGYGFLRTEKTGGFNLLNQIAHTGVRVKVLIPSGFTKEDEINLIKSNYHHIEFRSLQFSLQLVIGITIIDREKTMIFEIKDDTKDNFLQTLGLAIYIEGKSAALSYLSIFESLWKQTEMYEQLQIHDRMQKEFINTAAHELRTPIQPLLGLTQILRSKSKDKEQIELLDIVIRNTKKLKVLAENILDISKIESRSLKLNKGNFSLDSLILDIVKELGNKLVDENKKIKFEYSNSTDAHTLIHGDKNRIGQVISNLIGNSIKFINQKEGMISIRIRKGGKNGNDKDTGVVVEIKDTGIGIDPDIFPKLFTKFATKSFQGTGLGLYICKNIIEAHGGQIWAEDNTNNYNKEGKKGATFSFSIPLKDSQMNSF
ncbi:MAG TPA: HAMP domain-containing sensor histidine kinase, partial [Phototrophicaceae bacterium]|nr:HAMP domain-containing sensor histidine kinase [Phototrophicaceae bacterium]